MFVARNIWNLVKDLCHPVKYNNSRDPFISRRKLVKDICDL